jgi:hypothetical protein
LHGNRGDVHCDFRRGGLGFAYGELGSCMAELSQRVGAKYLRGYHTHWRYCRECNFLIRMRATLPLLIR